MKAELPACLSPNKSLSFHWLAKTSGMGDWASTPNRPMPPTVHVRCISDPLLKMVPSCT